MIILITGGTSGIGENLAQSLSVKNTVIICGTNKNKLLKKRNSNIKSYKCDVSNEKSVIKFSKLINKKVISVISRVVAIILVGLSVQYILDGIKTYLV